MPILEISVANAPRITHSKEDYLLKEKRLLGTYMPINYSDESCGTCNNCGSGDCSSCCGGTDD